MDLSYIQAVLYEAGKYVFLSNFILLLIVVMFERKVSSVVISLIVLVVANGAMSAMTPVLYQISLGSTMLHKLAWYGGFAALDCVAVFLLFKLHKLLGQSVSKVAQLTGLTFVMFCMIQSGRFVDRFIFDTELMAAVYQNVIPALNLILIPLIVFFWFDDLKIRRSFELGVTP